MRNISFISVTAILTLLLCRVNIVFSQEWEFKEIGVGDERLYPGEVVELSNGNFLVSSSFSYRSGAGDFYSEHPALMLMSSDGNEIVRNSFFRPGLCSVTFRPYLFENNGELYMLTTYSPDHDSTYFNYFKKYDNPPTDAIIGLYKIDNNLDIVESYEHVFPIDTFEIRTNDWEIHPNELSGHIFMFSAFEDEGNITGAYFKTVSDSNDNSRGQDSLFFFKMDFDGNFLVKKGYEQATSGGGESAAYGRQHIVKDNNCYKLYKRKGGANYHGAVDYYDNDFNYITTKHIMQSGNISPHSNLIGSITVARSNHNTTYLSTSTRSMDNPAHDEDVRLYEIDDDIDNDSDILPVLNYVERGTSQWDFVPVRGVDVSFDGKVFYAYSLNVGLYGNNDSWIMIEVFGDNLDTISTFYYDNVNVTDQIKSIKATKDGGVIMLNTSKDRNTYESWTSIIKFPASAFVSIEEAHAYNLHLAVAYPNPGGDVMNIRTSLRDCTLQVYDMQGRMVYQQEITDDVTSVDASNWQRGTYIWELKTENGKLKIEEGKWVK